MYWLHFALGVLIPILKMSIPTQLEKEKLLLIELRDSLNALYPPDPNPSLLRH